MGSVVLNSSLSVFFMNMGKKQIIIIIISALLVLLIGGWLYCSQFLAVNYLIPGVPYNGIYNLLFQRADSAWISSASDILGYWGDKRFELLNLQEKFPPGKITTFASTKKFFEENGYETYEQLSVEPDNVIKEIKKFVNRSKKIPVIVYQKQSLENFLSGQRVVIGVFDKEKKIIVHDHNLGNNYEISYDDFGKMSSPNSAILAVWPSDKIKGLIEGPNYSLPYPERLESMSKAGNLLATKRALAIWYIDRKDFEKANAFYRELVDDPSFHYFPPAFQVLQLLAFAQTYINLDQVDEAIKIIQERVLPINKNLSQSPQGWVVSSRDKSSYPYFVLSLAYLRKGQRDLAIAAYKDYKEIRSINNSIYEKAGETYLSLPPLIDELEKAISKKK